MSAWLEMGGYAQFVWPAYIVSAVVLVGVLWASLRKLKTAEDALAEKDEA